MILRMQFSERLLNAVELVRMILVVSIARLLEYAEDGERDELDHGL